MLKEAKIEMSEELEAERALWEHIVIAQPKPPMYNSIAWADMVIEAWKEKFVVKESKDGD